MAFTERYVRADADGNGDGTTDANSGATGSYTWAQMLQYAGTEATGGTLADVRFNVKAGTYSRTTAADTFATTDGAPTTALPLHIRGFNATIGDLEDNGRTQGGALVTTNFPAVTYTTGALTVPTYCLIESMNVESAISGVAVNMTVGAHAVRCKFANTHATSANARAASPVAGGNNLYEDCDLSVASSNAGGVSLGIATGEARRCLLTANTSGSGLVNITGAASLIQCSLRDASYGVTGGTNSAITVEGCSYRNIALNYNNHGSTAGWYKVVNCVAWGSGGASVWYNSTTSVRWNYQANNAVGNMGSADVNEGDWPVYDQVALTADPFTSSSDLTLNNTAGGGAACREVGLHPYIDIGAWQVQPATAAVLGAPNLRGFMQG